VLRGLRVVGETSIIRALQMKAGATQRFMFATLTANSFFPLVLQGGLRIRNFFNDKV
jgi:hypothetical protein